MGSNKRSHTEEPRETQVAVEKQSKKKKKSKRTDEDGSDTESAFFETQSKGESINVEFVFDDPDESDIPAAAMLLARSATLASPVLDLRALVNVLCNQGNIGSIIKVKNGAAAAVSAQNAGEAQEANDVTVSGIITILNIKQYGKELHFMHKFVKGVMSKHGNAQEGRYIAKILADSNINTGYLICEKFANFPLEILPDMYRNLLEDIKWSVSTEEIDDDEKKYYNFHHIIGIVSTYKSSIKKGAAEDEVKFMHDHAIEEELVRKSDVCVFWKTNDNMRVANEYSESPKKTRTFQHYNCMFAIAFNLFESTIHEYQD